MLWKYQYATRARIFLQNIRNSISLLFSYANISCIVHPRCIYVMHLSIFRCVRMCFILMKIQYYIINLQIKKLNSCFRLDVKGCKQNLSSNIPGRNRSSSNAFQLAPYSSSTRGILERRISQTPASTLKIVRSVSRESVRSAHHCTCPCLNTPVSTPK